MSYGTFKSVIKRLGLRAYSFLLRGRYVNKAKLQEPAAYLNVGCGKNSLSGFVNLDYTLWPGVDVCWDLRQPLPFPDCTFNGIFTEHCLEHIEYAECVKVLVEFFRILKPGCVVRIVVPDGGLYLSLYTRAQDGESVQFPYVGLAGKKDFEIDSVIAFTPIMAVNRIFRAYGHRFAYDFETMKVILEYVGFVGVNQCGYRVGSDVNLLVDTEYRAPQSLYVEAMKP